jgi:serine/threonine-protein kinase HipA
VKFRSSADPVDIGPIEATYAAMARAAGIRMPSTQLIATKSGPGYFATKRFDRDAGARKHVVSAAGVYDIAWQEPGLSYDGLLRLVRGVTRSQFEVEEMFRRMVFNVVASNRDDHAKQHSFLYDTDTKRWALSPAYDLTFSPGPGGEHYLAIAGEGRDVSLGAIHTIAQSHDIAPKHRDRIIQEVIEGASQWNVLGSDGLRASSKSTIRHAIDDAVRRLTR